jgi:multiple sugar transport system substrate-binding protein
VKSGWTPAKTEYPASIALFTSGKAEMHINGVWEVPTMVDLAKNGKLFDWGAIQIPVIFDHPATWADSHSFAIPDRKGNPVDPAKRKLVLDAVHWFNQHSLEWAGGGHVPAFLPVQESAEFKALKPNSDYSSLAKTAVFDPVSVLAGVASPVYDAAGNYVVPAMSGEIPPAEAAKQIRDDLQGQTK